jgi:hypothetical protein
MGVSIHEMPGKRSYHSAQGSLTAAQLRRQQRDHFHWTAHSSGGKKFIEVNENMVKPGKAMLTGKALHLTREAEIGCPSHHGRLASRAALVSGVINSATHNKDLATYKKANAAKHGPRAFWADCCDSDDNSSTGNLLTLGEALGAERGNITDNLLQ